MSHTNGVGGSPLLQTLLSRSDAVATAKSTQGVSAGSSTQAPAQDKAQVSAAATALLSGAGDDVRSHKVDSIRAAIANGTYAVSSSDVADKLIQNLLR